MLERYIRQKDFICPIQVIKSGNCMKFFKLISVLDIFCLMSRYSKVPFKQLFLLHFDKNCKIMNQYYNILKDAQASQGLHRRVWLSFVLVRIACVARIVRTTLFNNYKSQNSLCFFLINVLGLIFETTDIRTNHHKLPRCFRTWE